MRIHVIGVGYVGLVTAACLADSGNIVRCIDIDQEKIEELCNGKVPFHEPSLTEIVTRNIENKRLFFSSQYDLNQSDNIIFLCVGTPDKGDGQVDLAALQSVLKSISPNLRGKNYIFTKSTVPLGTNNYIESMLKQMTNKDTEIFVASNPEFLKEGDAVNDFIRPDRIIIGSDNEEIKKIAYEIYKPFNWNNKRLIFMSRQSAELTKYASNAFLATKISFMNEVARICDNSGADIHEIRDGMGSDPRIGKDFLYAGLGFGGSCFPKDVRAMLKTYKAMNLPSDILDGVLKVNNEQIDYFLEKFKTTYGKKLATKTFTIWGLSFKPNTDDLRESLAIKLILKLSPLVKEIYAFDPVSNEKSRRELLGIQNITFCDEKYEQIPSSDSLVICTEWKEFWNPDLNKLSTLRDKIIFDGRNVLDKPLLLNNDFKYIGLGV
jgi:UDPglucose 6-dehydrogenase